MIRNFKYIQCLFSKRLRFLQVFCLGVVCGIFAGWVVSKTVEGSSDVQHSYRSTSVETKSIPPLRKNPLEGDVIPPSYAPPNDTPSPPFNREIDKIVRLPINLSNTILPALLGNRSTELDDMALIPYGLSQENAKNLRLYLNEQAKKLAKMEAENSEIIPTSDGGEFIRIKAFPDAGGVLRKEVESEIDSYFSGFNDDRAQIFKKQLFSTILYDDFGSTSKEISIDTAIAPGGDPNTPGLSLP